MLLTLNASRGTPSPTTLPVALPLRTQAYLTDTRHLDTTKSDKCILVSGSKDCISTLLEGWTDCFKTRKICEDYTPNLDFYVLSQGHYQDISPVFNLSIGHT